MEERIDTQSIAEKIAKKLYEKKEKWGEEN